jgi:hypothetical protein
MGPGNERKTMVETSKMNGAAEVVRLDTYL